MQFYPKYKQGRLDPQSASILKKIAESEQVPLTSMTPEQARDLFFRPEWLGDPEPEVAIQEISIPGPKQDIPLHIYNPEQGQDQGKLPVLIYFHGGGFVLGRLPEFDPQCSYLAAGASSLVVSVGYRLAPENKCPAAFEDACVAVDWAMKHIHEYQGDPVRVALCGSSAGANLAAAVALFRRDQSLIAPIYQALICPSLDLYNIQGESVDFFSEGLWLSLENLHWYRSHYLQYLDQAQSPYISPLQAEDLAGLPPAFILTAEFDILRDQGKIYADRLRSSGVEVQYSEYKGMLHDFVLLPGMFERAREAIQEISAVLKNTFSLIHTRD